MSAVRTSDAGNGGLRWRSGRSLRQPFCAGSLEVQSYLCHFSVWAWLLALLFIFCLLLCWAWLVFFLRLPGFHQL